MPETLVFISYTHDSDEHAAKVRQLADSLRKLGLHTLLDQYELPRGPAEGWPRWMERGIQRASHIVCVCSDNFRRRLEGQEDPAKGKGADWEGNIVYNLLYRAKSTSNKVVPVLFDAEPEASLPLVLDGLHRHRLPADFEGLFRHLSDQPVQGTPTVAAGVMQLPPKPAPQLDPAWDLTIGLDGAPKSSPTSPPPPAGPSKEQARSDFTDLLLELFTPDELRRFIAHSPQGEKLSRALPIGPVTEIELATAAVGALERAGKINDALFASLSKERPGRVRDIDPVARTWSAFTP